jgi:organic hydroperoxide reductase OsmC/OhrA
VSREHAYEAVARWEGSTGAGYEAYSRAHEVRCPPAGAALALSSDPAFCGEPGRLNPEQLLLAAASSCQLLSFLAVAARARIDVVGYEDRASARMPEDEPPVRITEITLRPAITVRGGPSEEQLRHLVEVAHRECFIARSVTATITIAPTFVRS